MLFSQSVSSASMMRCCLASLSTPTPGSGRPAAAELPQEFVRVEPEAEIGDLAVADLKDLAKPERGFVAGRLELAVPAHVEIRRVRARGDVVDFVDRVAAALHVLDRDAA